MGLEESMETKDRTYTVLIEDLLKKPQTERRDELILRAAEGHYSDFQSPVVTPKIKLNEDLLAAGYEDLAANTRVGRYD